MAARLEAATKQYGVPILLSGPLHDILSADIKALCREIDKVTVKGSIQPITLFTIDLDYNGLTVKIDNYLDYPVKEKKAVSDKRTKMLR